MLSLSKETQLQLGMNEKEKKKLRESLLSYFSTDPRFDVFHTETLSDNICNVVKETLEEVK